MKCVENAGLKSQPCAYIIDMEESVSSFCKFDTEESCQLCYCGKKLRQSHIPLMDDSETDIEEKKQRQKQKNVCSCRKSYKLNHTDMYTVYTS